VRRAALAAGLAAGIAAAIRARRRLSASARTAPSTLYWDPEESEPVSPAPQARGRFGRPTKAELYERARALRIEGRSRMTKEELRRAVEAHERVEEVRA
jgi:hypothetical protein